MWIHHSLWLDEDPLPVPPASFGTAAYWRWLSARTLAAKADAMTTTQPRPLVVALTDVTPHETLTLHLEDSHEEGHHAAEDRELRASEDGQAREGPAERARTRR